MENIVLQVGDVREFIQELRIDAEKVLPKVVRYQIQYAPAPAMSGLQIKENQKAEHKRNVWFIASAILSFGQDPASWYILRSEFFCGVIWVNDGANDPADGQAGAMAAQDLLSKFCEAQKWELRIGLYRYANETV